MSNFMIVTGERKWIRYRFKTNETEDPRPLKFNPRYPWWRSGCNDDSSTIIMWLPEGENLKYYYDDAFNIEKSIHNQIEFSGKFSKPEYFVES